MDPTRPPNEWELSDQGRTQVKTLTTAPFWENVAALYSSGQPKAMGAAGAISAYHHIPMNTLSGLSEVARGTEVYHSAGDYDTILGKFFAYPDHVVAGWERGTDALARFSRAVEYIISQHPDESVALLSHGTILTLFTAMLDQEPPTLDRWRAIGFASVATMQVKNYRLITTFIGAPYEGVPIA